MGASWVKIKWMDAVLDVVRGNPHHTFMFLTKQPRNLGAWPWPENTWLGTTVTKRSEADRIDDLYHFTDSHMTFASFEPLLGFVSSPNFRLLSWAIVGAQTGPEKRGPSKTWIGDALRALDDNRVPVFMKSNLKPYWDGEWRQEWP
jgi:protein gp37